jgi:hypothetical protein
VNSGQLLKHSWYIVHPKQSYNELYVMDDWNLHENHLVSDINKNSVHLKFLQNN